MGEPVGFATASQAQACFGGTTAKELSCFLLKKNRVLHVFVSMDTQP
jgi:hypothetical protein